MVCELRPREVQGFPESGFGYTAQEVLRACKSVAKTIKSRDELVPKRLLDELRAQRETMHTLAAEANRREVKAQLTSTTESTRQRNAHYAGRLREALNRGDLEAVARIADEAAGQ